MSSENTNPPPAIEPASRAELTEERQFMRELGAAVLQVAEAISEMAEVIEQSLREAEGDGAAAATPPPDPPPPPETVRAAAPPPDPPPVPEPPAAPAGPIAAPPPPAAPAEGEDPPTPPHKEEYTRTAFMSKLVPGMFPLPANTDPKEREVKCLRLNYLLKLAERMGERSDIVDELGLNRGKTGAITLDKLDEVAGQLWEKICYKSAQEEAGVENVKLTGLTVPEGYVIPERYAMTSDEMLILEDRLNWQQGAEWSREGAEALGRPATITGAEVDMSNPKQASVTAKKLKEMNRQLAAANSFVSFEQTGPADPETDMVPIAPKWRGREVPPARVAGEDHSKLVRVNDAGSEDRGLIRDGVGAEDAAFVSWADCHRTAQMIIGSTDTPAGIDDTEVVTLPGIGMVRPISKDQITGINNASDIGANRTMHAAFNAAIPAFSAPLIAEALERLGGPDEDDPTGRSRLETRVRELEAELEGDAVGDRAEKEAEKKRLDTLLVLQKGAQQKEAAGSAPVNLREQYRVICDDPELLEAFSAEFKLNAHAEPKVGGAFAQINDEVEKAQGGVRLMSGEEGGAPQDFWNFHFAGVVMVNPEDGSYMTLENLSTEDPTAINDNWYFALYDPAKGKDFHSVNARDSHVGSYPLTMVFEVASPPEALPEEGGDVHDI